ncbi:hypothetical protein HDU81_006522 [Chytriomyces hyalinus]|nr:hypothetical protein HDU81_006522 [Chytriomyces hyalinus]
MVLTDAPAILRESLELKQKLAFLQSQLIAGLSQIERVVDLVSPSVDPGMHVEILEEIDAVDDVQVDRHGSSSSRRMHDSRSSPKDQSSYPHARLSKTAVDTQLLTMPSVLELVDIQPNTTTTEMNPSCSKTSASKTSEASEKRVKIDETTASQALSAVSSGVGSMSQMESGVRWDAEDYKSHDDLHNPSSMEIPPVPKNPLRKSLTSSDRNKKRSSIIHAFRPFSWVSSGGSKPLLSALHSGFEKGAAVSFSMSDVEMGKKADSVVKKAESLVYELDSSIRITDGSNPAKSKHGLPVQLTSRSESIKLRPKSMLAKESHLPEYSTDSVDCSADPEAEPPATVPQTIAIIQAEKVQEERPSQVNWRKVKLAVVKSHHSRPIKEIRADAPENAVVLRTASMQNTKKDETSPKSISRSNMALSLIRKKTPIQKKTVEPVHQDFEMASTRFQRWFLCKAFDDKGGYLAYEFRQADSLGNLSFWRIGLHPMSMANAISGSGFIAVYFFMIFAEPYCASFSGNDDLFSSIVWM